ncbi:MAG: hypothetical protein ACE5ER_13045, partial [Nitrospinaceae bacterium]
MAGSKKLWGQTCVCLLVLGMLVAPAFAFAPAVGPHGGHETQTAVDRPAWLHKLENQVRYEELMEGKQGNSERLDKTFMSIMDRL